MAEEWSQHVGLGVGQNAVAQAEDPVDAVIDAVCDVAESVVGVDEFVVFGAWVVDVETWQANIGVGQAHGEASVKVDALTVQLLADEAVRLSNVVATGAKEIGVVCASVNDEVLDEFFYDAWWSPGMDRKGQPQWLVGNEWGDDGSPTCLTQHVGDGCSAVVSEAGQLLDSPSGVACPAEIVYHFSASILDILSLA